MHVSDMTAFRPLLLKSTHEIIPDSSGNCVNVGVRSVARLKQHGLVGSGMNVSMSALVIVDLHCLACFSLQVQLPRK